MKNVLLLVLLTFPASLVSCTSATKEISRDVAGKTHRQRKVGRILAPPIFFQGPTRQTTVPSLVGRVDFIYEAHKIDDTYTLFLNANDPAAEVLRKQGAPLSLEKPDSFSVTVQEKDIEFLKASPCSSSRNICIGDFIAQDSKSAETYTFSQKNLNQPSHQGGVYEIWLIANDPADRSFILTEQGFVAEEDLTDNYKRQECAVLTREGETVYRCRR